MVELRSRSIPPSPEKPGRRRGQRAADVVPRRSETPTTTDDSELSDGSVDGSALLDCVPDVPFSQLCHDGRAVTAKNFLVKLWRYTIVPTKELYLPWMFSGLPTNYLMLTYRTFNRDFGLPNCNDDYLAPLLRDELMPERGRMHRERDPGLWYRTRALDLKYVGVPGIVNFVDARTQWVDDGMARALDGGVRQVVIVAAGFDTRAYRLGRGRAGVKFFEVDLPHASAKKRALVEKLFPADEYPRPAFIGADLAKVDLADALEGSGFDARAPTLFLIEGLVYYLPPPAFQSLLAAIGALSARGSRLLFDFIHLSTMSGEAFYPGFETLMVSVWNKGEHFLSGVNERPEMVRALLKKFGFSLAELLDADGLAARYLPHLVPRAAGAPPPLPPYFGYIEAARA